MQRSYKIEKKCNFQLPSVCLLKKIVIKDDNRYRDVYFANFKVDKRMFMDEKTNINTTTDKKDDENNNNILTDNKEVTEKKEKTNNVLTGIKEVSENKEQKTKRDYIYDFSSFRKRIQNISEITSEDDENLLRFENTLFGQQIKAIEHGYKTDEVKTCIFTNEIKITFETFQDDPDEFDVVEEYVKRG
jgi:hypothetical protein